MVSLSEITLLPPAGLIGSLTAAQISIDRETVKARWFASPADINYATDVPGQPVNPSSQDFLDTSTPPLPPLTPNNYIEPVPVNPANPPSLANPIRPTAIRDYEYTWAAMIQRRLVAAPEGNITDRRLLGRTSSIGSSRGSWRFFASIGGTCSSLTG